MAMAMEDRMERSALFLKAKHCSRHIYPYQYILSEQHHVPNHSDSFGTLSRPRLLTPIMQYPFIFSFSSARALEMYSAMLHGMQGLSSVLHLAGNAERRARIPGTKGGDVFGDWQGVVKLPPTSVLAVNER